MRNDPRNQTDQQKKQGHGSQQQGSRNQRDQEREPERVSTQPARHAGPRGQSGSQGASHGQHGAGRLDDDEEDFRQH